jgi:hypothetical protein
MGSTSPASAPRPSFFDYDGDGDLDMYLLNHSIHQNGTFGPRHEIATANPYSGDRLYRNDGNGHFTDVTKQSGINSSVIGYGLGINISDINLDGYPDLYIGNDFHENDYLYINQRRHLQRRTGRKYHAHQPNIPWASTSPMPTMTDIPKLSAWICCPIDPYILKRSEGEDSWDIYKLKIGLWL